MLALVAYRTRNFLIEIGSFVAKSRLLGSRAYSHEQIKLIDDV